MSLHERRAQADHAATEAAFRGMCLRRRIDALCERVEPHRASLTVATGLAIGALTSLLPLRRVVRAGILGMDGFLLLVRLLPQRTPSPPARASAAIAPESARDT
jgi:hypothetical protein